MNRSLISTLQFQSIEPQKHCNSVFLISNFQISPPKSQKKLNHQVILIWATKKKILLSIESWLFTREPYNGLL